MATSNALGIGRLWQRRVGDEELFARAQRGDDNSFAELHRRFSPALFGYCIVRLRDHQAAEDAVQEVFLHAMRSQPTDLVNTRAWLFAIARTTVIDAARRSKAITRHVEPVDDVESLAGECGPTHGADTTGAIFLALRRLPARQRKALMLREFQDLSSVRIADEMSTSPANVDVLVTRARTAFGKTYADLQQLPAACRRATELIYRELGSGIPDNQAEAMHAHLEACPRCKSEYRRAHAKERLQALLSIPAFLTGGLHHTWDRIDTSLRSAALNVDQLLLPHWSRAAKAGVGLALAAVALSPVALERTTISEPRPFQSVLTAGTMHSEPAPKSTDLLRERSEAFGGDDQQYGRNGDGVAHLQEGDPLRFAQESVEGDGAQWGSGTGARAMTAESYDESRGGGTGLSAGAEKYGTTSDSGVSGAGEGGTGVGGPAVGGTGEGGTGEGGPGAESPSY